MGTFFHYGRFQPAYPFLGVRQVAGVNQSLCHQNRYTSTTATPSFEYLLLEKRPSGVAIIQLNRPKALNALCLGLLEELVNLLQTLDKDSSVRSIVLTGAGKGYKNVENLFFFFLAVRIKFCLFGSKKKKKKKESKAFSAGADIKEMEPKNYMDVYKEDMFTIADKIAYNVRKPIIAAVNGFALGGGCELAMTCDIIIASDKAKFGQPEINLGTIPGIGGTQRLTRAIGKSRAMELCLTGDLITAQQASEWGLVSRVVPHEKVLQEAIDVAEKIAKKSVPIAIICKEAVNRSFESSLKEGVLFERRLFHSTFSTKDQKEGMSAFSQKKEAKWQDA
ncbi:enoyl-CoA hydratase/isomerase [Reticulomyxa filosa]|uniref:Enoyl-CoA hydratase/isomerase n=1 Tax=Reticulomyxa filosa TaxID=46433 RepID=X6NCY6_RETFI|nr:enoyl-CoA hydratase/isomerase [Reticulomyxa filosa]|eukprot:ETO23634.1 enoyl-CoA hydratase/isomerase [Reticulomyxa filosa]